MWMFCSHENRHARSHAHTLLCTGASLLHTHTNTRVANTQKRTQAHAQAHTHTGEDSIVENLHCCKTRMVLGTFLKFFQFRFGRSDLPDEIRYSITTHVTSSSCTMQGTPAETSKRVFCTTWVRIRENVKRDLAHAQCSLHTRQGTSAEATNVPLYHILISYMLHRKLAEHPYFRATIPQQHVL